MHFIPYSHQTIDDSDIDAVVKTLQSDWLTTGPKVPEFENAMTQYIGCNHATAVNSGTSALDLSLQTVSLERGSEIITTPFTFAATSNAILYNGLKPIYADIVKKSRNIDPDDIRKKITPKTSALLVVDYAGHPCDLTAIKEICSDYDLILIEDACHALGASYHRKKIGTIADMTIFSFHPVKAITTGEGGMIVTDNPKYAKKLNLLRTHGIDKNLSPHNGVPAGWEYDMVDLGRNYRMTDIQAVLGISQLKKLDGFIKRRNMLASLYTDLLSDVSFIEIPESMEGVHHAWHIYTVLLKGIDRNSFFTYMRKHNIGVNLHYIPTYRLSYYKKQIPNNPADFPITEEVYGHIITLPLFPRLTEKEIHYIVDTAKKAFTALS
jgi:UDP-4-amino-4,6-dideoxy-N-acetyl-beta-L-altrosamine transaminase